MEKEDSLFVTFNFQEGRIKLSKQVIDKLGVPKHIRLLVNSERLLFAVQPCEEDDYSSFAVPMNLNAKTGVRLYSITLISLIWDKMNWDKNKTHNVVGVWSEKNNAVLFNLTKWTNNDF